MSDTPRLLSDEELEAIRVRAVEALDAHGWTPGEIEAVCEVVELDVPSLLDHIEAQTARAPDENTYRWERLHALEQAIELASAIVAEGAPILRVADLVVEMAARFERYIKEGG